jgi:hypothetical protein
VAAAVACTAFDDVPKPTTTVQPADDAATAPEEGATDTLPAPGILSLTEAAQLCSVIARCPYLGESVTAQFRIPVVEQSYSLCLTELSTTLEPKRPGKDATARALREVAAAPTCEAASSLLALEPVLPGDPRCQYDGGGPLDRCIDAVTALHCQGPNKAGLVRHCSRPNHLPGETCFLSAGTADCALGKGCPGPGCVGPVLTFCRPSNTMRDFYTNQDCNLLGMQCAIGPDNNIGCSTDDKAIRSRSDFVLGAECKGTKKVTTSETYFGEIDCAALGATCTASGTAAICAFPTDECSPFGAASETCSGTTFHGCVAGKKSSFDCATIGKACVLGSTSGFAVACE